ncbi:MULTISPECIES: Gfo/Idh/MocA family protein [Paenibacillus]|uniref:Gfo/Idh/MocA family protein n=1 Tax=Paenibacillus TaxID=44249 RepID=UPI0022B9276A|nr:Gfo/Idh/MocA family oxidoreductase [Paenibacillus caseinilyticus]MCZ8518330.1 Gfo/Idh/MocA family oxidoreductase [Paenibacillus caseinilyticus]
MNKIKWGVLGTGWIVNKAGQGLLASGNGQWLGVAGREAGRGKALAEQYGVPRAYDSYRELLEDPDIEAVYIALLNHLHEEWAVEACRAGKHVLLEKPFALNAEQTRRITEAAGASGVRVREAFIWPFYPGIREIKQLLDGGAIGEWVRFRGHFSFRAFEESTRWNQAWGGGALYDIGCYLVHWARSFTGVEPLAADAVWVQDERHGVDRRFCGTLLFPEGKTAQFDAALDMPHGSSFELLGTEGRLAVIFQASPDQLTVTCRHPGGELAWTTDRITPFRLQAEAFADGVLRTREGEAAPGDGGLEALRQAAAMDALREAAETGRRSFLG